MRRIAVIGGGASGLAAAARLGALGADVTLLERDAVPGGQLRTHRDQGWLVERGALLVAEPAPPVRALLDSAGLGPRTIRASAAARRRYVVHRGEALPIPATLGDLIASPLLSIAGRLRMAREPFVGKRTTGEDESVDAFARRRFGDEVAERLFDSLVSEMCGGDATRVLARYLFPRLVEFEQSAGSVLKGQMRAGMEARRRTRGKPLGAWSCPDGLGEVAMALAAAAGVRVHTGARVTGLEPSTTGYWLTTDSGREHFDGVVATLSPLALAEIAGPASWRARVEGLAAMPVASVVSVALGFRREAVAHPLDGLSLRVPSHEGRPLLAVFVPTAVFPGRAPEGHVQVSAVMGGARHPELVAMAAPDLVALAESELAGLLGITAPPRFSDVTAWPAALPQPVAGHGEHLAAATLLEAELPGVVLTGSWRDGLAVSDVLRGGVCAAERLIPDAAAG